jgi:hypothetical protein
MTPGHRFTTDGLRSDLTKVVNPINTAVDGKKVAAYLSAATTIPIPISLLEDTDPDSDLFRYDANYAAGLVEAGAAITAIPVHPTEYHVRNWPH